jgi:hypothetical protein
MLLFCVRSNTDWQRRALFGGLVALVAPSFWRQPGRSNRMKSDCFGVNASFEVGPFNSAGLSSFQENLLVLPTGQVIAFSTDNSEVDIYTPKGPSYHRSWQPVVHKHPACVIPGDTYSLEGRQFNGLTEAGYYGDDVQASTNYPIVRIVNDRSGHVFYARTFNHSSRSIAPNAPVATNFQVNAPTETGDSTLYVVANGIPSAGRKIHVSHTCPVAVAKDEESDRHRGDDDRAP